MKNIRNIAFYFAALAFLFLACWGIYKTSARRSIILAEQTPTTQIFPSPTPLKSSRKKNKPSASPTPNPCAPDPTPESEKKQPRELTLKQALDITLGSTDVDCDGVCNWGDNCVLVYNPDQKDTNGDGVGDACDPRFVDPSFVDSRCDGDSDGVPDRIDNCPAVCNPDQADVNKNGIGDVCDPAFPHPILARNLALSESK